MRKPVFFSFFAVITVVDFSFSCRKNKNTTPQKFTGCRITNIKEDGPDSLSRTMYNFYYNENGTVQRIFIIQPRDPNSGHTRFFTYKDNYIKIRDVASGGTWASVIDSMVLDSVNRVSFIYHINGYYTYNNNNWDQYTYDGAGNMALHTIHQNTSEYTDTLRWQDGDETGYSEDLSAGWGENIYSFACNDTLLNTGNITSGIKDMESYGRGVYTSKHLRKSATCVSCSSLVMNYAYHTDSMGKLIYQQDIPMDGAITNAKSIWITYACQ